MKEQKNEFKTISNASNKVSTFQEKEFYEAKCKRISLKFNDRVNQKHGWLSLEALKQKVEFKKVNSLTNGVNFEYKAGLGLFGSFFGHGASLNQKFR